MSSGIEILILAPLLWPALAGSGVTLAGGVVAAGGTAGGVVVTGGSVVTTGAFATGSIAGAAGGATTSALAAGAAVAGGAVLVVGAAGAALLAAQHLQSTYDAALSDYHRRLEGEQVEAQTAQRVHGEAISTAILRARKTRVQAAESADLAFLRAGVQRLQKRLREWPDVDPQLPGSCAQLLSELAQPSPELPALFAAYESLSALVAAQAAKRRELLTKLLSAATTADALKSLQQEVETEIRALRAEATLAPPAILSEKVRVELERALERVEGLAAIQPRMAEQGLQMLRGRVGRELSLGAARDAQQRQAQDKSSARLRELAGRVSARSQATLAVLENEELAASPLARVPIGALRTQAMAHLQRLAALLSGEMPAGLAPLEKLTQEADALFDTTGDQLQQIAQQIYLEAQVAEVFMELGYQVTTVSEPNTGSTGMLASLDGGRGVEVRLDGAGNLCSEMVALSPAATDIEPHAQEKVCALMDEVFESLRARGCVVREKKRRHFKKGERSLRVVKMPEKKKTPVAPISAPVARRIDQ